MGAPVTSLRVVSYNVHSLRDDRHALVEVVRDLAPDVVILQEAPRRLRWRSRCADLAHDFGLVVAAGGQPALGNLLATNLRVRVHDTYCLRYPLTPGRHLRGAAFAHCSIGGTPFLLAGSHLSTDPAERPAQAALLKKELAGADAPVVFGGDLNEEAAGAAWRTVAEGLVDVAAAAGGAELPTFSRTDPRRRIDALFVTENIEVLRCDVPRTGAVRLASDHFPVVADVVLPAALGTRPSAA